MTSTSISEEEKNIYEKELSDFIIQRVKHSGGSIQFQHLYATLQQIRYEVRETFGTSKSELMKFLKAHRDSFKVDPKGIVTVIDSPAEESKISNCIELTNKFSNVNSKKTLPPNIENGKGRVIRIAPEFGVIKAEGLDACIYFTPANYNANKETLFFDHKELGRDSEVYFNAVYGNEDHEIQYRAVKVWQKRDEYAYPPISNNKNSRESTKGKNETHLSDNDGSKSKIDSKSQRNVVEVKRNSDSKSQRNVVEVKRNWDSKSQRNIDEIKKNSEKCQFSQPPSHSKANEKDTARKNEVLENERGRIYPYENKNGAVIKFGKNYSELAAGDSSKYYLYGVEVSDIRYEFREGDDVFFDAVSMKSAPNWKAISVWMGEKPADAKRKTFIKEMDENDDEQNYASADTSDPYKSVSSAYKTTKSSHFNTEFVRKKSNISFDTSKKDTRSHVKHKQNKIDYSKNNSQKTQFNKCRNKKTNSKRKNVYNWESSEEENESENKICNSKDFQRTNKYECSASTRRLKFGTVDDDEGEISSEHSNEKIPESNKSNVKGKSSTRKFKFKTVDDDEEEEISSEHSNETIPESNKGDGKGKASIRTFKNVEGEITRLLCQAALVKSPILGKEIDFIKGFFYLDGQPVSDDESVTDLREILKIGDHIKFNCFIIIDDKNEKYDIVTLAWKGKKPEGVPEQTPKDFILENDLSVSQENYSDNDSIQEHENTQNRFLTVIGNEDSDETDSNSKSSALNIGSEDANDISENINYVSEDEIDMSEDKNYTSEDKNDTSEDDMFGHCAMSSKKVNENNNISVNSHYKLLSEKIIQELKESGVISFHPKVDLNHVIDGISSVLKNSNIYLDASLNQEVPLRTHRSTDSSEILCPKHCQSKSAQTIITGEIVATRDKFPVLDRKKKCSR